MGAFIKINNCRHYILNEKGLNLLYFIHNRYLVEKDFALVHPLGTVYKPKGVPGTLIRFIKQPNNSTLMFKANEWNVKENPFYVHPKRFTFKGLFK